MQFIFASDKDSGYGLLYIDGDKKEAVSVHSLIDIPITDGIDSFGFIPFGTNGNRPLFFEVKKDISYPRGAHYIHGVYQNASREYFSTNAYERDLFTKLIDQEGIDRYRDNGMIGEIDPVVDTTLSADKVQINDGVFKGILAGIYQGKKLLIAVPDSLYSTDYVKCFMAKIFRYLTPSLRKYCSFISGVINVGKSNAFQVRIVPKSMLVNVNESYVDIEDDDTVSCDSTFGRIVGNILQLRRESLEACERFFQNYEELYYGYDSRYNPNKMRDYFLAVADNDSEAYESVLNSYVGNTSDPIAGALTKYLSSDVKKRYESFEYFAKQLDLNDVDFVFNPEAVLENNYLMLRKWFAVVGDKVYSEHIQKALGIAISAKTEALDDDKISSILKRINKIDKSVILGENNRKFCEAYADKVYEKLTELKNLLESCTDIKNQIISVLKNRYAGDMCGNRFYYFDEEKSRLEEELGLSMKSEDCRYDFHTLFVKELKRLIEYSNQVFQENERIMLESAEREKKRDYQNKLLAGDIYGARQRLNDCIELRGEYECYELIAEYLLKVYELDNTLYSNYIKDHPYMDGVYSETDTRREFDPIIKRFVMSSDTDVLKTVAEKNFTCGACLIIRYCKSDEFLIELLRYLVYSSEYICKISKAELENISEELNHRLRTVEFASEQIQIIDNALKFKVDKKARKVFNVIKKSWNKFKKKLKKAKNKFNSDTFVSGKKDRRKPFDRASVKWDNEYEDYNYDEISLQRVCKIVVPLCILVIILVFLFFKFVSDDPVDDGYTDGGQKTEESVSDEESSPDENASDEESPPDEEDANKNTAGDTAGITGKYHESLKLATVSNKVERQW